MKSTQRNALVFRTGFSVRVFLDELEVLDAAEKLLGKREGQHSIRINDQWRICFRWREGNAYDVEIVDYH